LEETSRHIPDLVLRFNPRRPDFFIASWYDEGASHENLLSLITNLNDGTSELMCHPGYADEAFAYEAVYNYQRERELQILTDPSIKEAIMIHGIMLIDFAEL
jgi:chitin disaccharide deacetylase